MRRRKKLPSLQQNNLVEIKKASAVFRSTDHQGIIPLFQKSRHIEHIVPQRLFLFQVKAGVKSGMYSAVIKIKGDFRLVAETERIVVIGGVPIHQHSDRRIPIESLG